MSSPTISTLTSFSGADLVVTFANQVIGELQQISWAVQREKAPVFTLGSPDARSFTRGKRAIAGNLVFAVFDHDSIVSAMQYVWDQIAPPAMFTAKGNLQQRATDNFLNAIDMLKWNVSTSQAAQEDFGGTASNATGYGFSGSSSLQPNKQPGSNGAPTTFDNESNYFVDSFGQGQDIYVPAGFSPIRGDNIQYADTLPPFDATLTFANEYGQTAFQKIYDMDILNEGSGVSVDTVIMERQMTYIARKLSPLIRGVYSRDESGTLKGKSPTSKN